MFAYLKAQEVVHSISSLQIFCRNLYAPAVRQVLCRIENCALEPLHRIYTRWCLPVYERRDTEVSLCKHSRNFRHVLPDCVSRGDVRGFIGGNFDCAAVWEEFEVLNGFLLIKTVGFFSV